MAGDRPDVIELLETERTWHIEQIDRISIALAALKGETKKLSAQANGSPKVAWTAHVMEIFNEANRPLSLEDIRKKLAQKGITQALDDQNRPTIYSTLTRGLSRGRLEKAGYGKYRKKKEVAA